MSNNPIPTNINVQELTRKGEEIYQQDLKGDLEQHNNGEYVAIEVESKQHYVGITKEEAVAKAKKEYPNKIFFVRRIGEIEKIASYSLYNPLALQ